MQSAVTEALVRQELLFALVLETLQQDRYEEEDAAAGDGADEERDDARGLAVADLLLTAARAERLLHASGANAESAAGTLGLTPVTLRRGVGLEDEQQLRSLQETAQLVLLPRIERKLRLKCSELCDAMLPGLVHANRQPQAPSSASRSANAPTSSSSVSVASSASTSSSSLLARAAELPALLLEAQAKKAQVALENRQLKEQLRLQLQQDTERCRAMAELVAQLLRAHKRDDQARVLRAKIRWLAAFSDAMRLKAQVLAAQLAVETYPPDRVAVLEAAHAELQTRKSQALEERDTLRAKLQLYQSADAEYQSIALEYGAVLRSVDEKRSWLRSLDL